MEINKFYTFCFIFNIFVSKALGDIQKLDPYQYCTVDVTIAIDFSNAMLNKINIENLVNFVLHNFTNILPFNNTSVSLALLPYGINNTKVTGYFNNYANFSNELQNNFNQILYSDLQPANLSDDQNSIGVALPIANEIKSLTNPECLKGNTDTNCNKIIMVGINQTSPALYDLGNWIFLVSFNNYTLQTGDNYFGHETIDQLSEISIYEFLVTICTLVIDVNTFPCGEGYCEDSICMGKENGCYNYGACIENQCLYWDASVKTYTEAEEICQKSGTSLIFIDNENFQQELYEWLGDVEFWIGLNSLGSCTLPVWKWDQPSGSTISLNDTKYTNWGIGQPGSWGCSCVADSNSSHWEVYDCSEHKYIACMKPATISTTINPSKFYHTVWFILIVILIILLSLSIPFYYFYIKPKIQKRFRKNKELEISKNSSTPNTIGSTNSTWLDLDGNLQTDVYTLNTFKTLDLDEPTRNQAQEQFRELESCVNLNILTFPHIHETYIFNMADFVDRSLIEASSRHLVQKYLHKPSGELLAVKNLIIPASRHDEETTKDRFQKLLREIENFRNLCQHPNILDFYGICIYEVQVLLCMEPMDLSLKHLYKAIHKLKEPFPEDLIGYVAVKMIDALWFCKSHGVIHKDIKPSNILVNYSGEIKLCDFGESRILENSLASTHVGTIPYMAPEFFTDGNTKYDIRSDIWSLGISLVEINLGRLPYLSELPSESENIQGEGHKSAAQLSAIAIINRITTSTLNEVIEKEIKPKYSEELCNFLKLCLQKVEIRPNLDELKGQAFYELNNLMKKFEVVKSYIAKFKPDKSDINQTNININVPKSSSININIHISE